MKSAAAGAVTVGAGGVLGEASRAQGAVTLAPGLTQRQPSVSGMIVRADHSPTAAGKLAVGVRASIWHLNLEATGVVLVVEPVDFTGAEAINVQIASGLRQQVGSLLAERGHPTDPEEIAVQLFGGAL